MFRFDSTSAGADLMIAPFASILSLEQEFELRIRKAKLEALVQVVKNCGALFICNHVSDSLIWLSAVVQCIDKLINGSALKLLYRAAG